MADPTTQSNYLQIASEHVHFDWALDFHARTISGSATHHLLVKEDNVKEVMWVESRSELFRFFILASSFDTFGLDIIDAEIECGPAEVSVSKFVPRSDRA